MSEKSTKATLEVLPARAKAIPTTTYLQDVAAEAQEIIAAGVPENTRRTYQAQWTRYLAWCHQHEHVPMPAQAETLALYLTDRAREVKVSTLNVALAAITRAHREAGHPDWSAVDLPGIRLFLRGLRRKKGRPPTKKQALRLEDLVRGLPEGDSLKAVRNRALLLVGFYAALRRSELIGLNIDDVRKSQDGVTLFIRRSKTDKESQGQLTSLPRVGGSFCPVAALERWLVCHPKAQSDEGGMPVFTSLRSGARLPDYAVADVVKRAAQQAGFDPSGFGAHSLRSGFATSAAEADAEERDIMRVTRHRSERTVRGYIHEVRIGENHPGRKIAARLEGDSGRSEDDSSRK